MISRSAIPAKRPAIFPLSKCLEPQDLEGELEAERQAIELVDGTQGQHPMRLWEYSMAHRAIKTWTLDRDEEAGGLVIGDVGGAGSRFWATLAGAFTIDQLRLIDPALPKDFTGGRILGIQQSVEDYAAHSLHGQLDVLTAISVLEHVEEPRRFLRACRMLLKPGGLLFLTMDCWNHSGPDTAHFHWMRQRIYTPDLVRALQASLGELGFSRFGRSDWTYNGDFVFNYSFCSLAMIKRPL